MSRYCPKCGTAASDDDVLCQKCGNVLKPEAVSDAEVIEVTEDTQELSVDDDSADVIVASMIDDNDCGSTEDESVPVIDSQPLVSKEIEVDIIEEETVEDEISADKAESAETTFYQEPPVYQSTPQYEEPKEEVSKVLSLGDWLLTLILVCIPIVNLVMLIYWSAANAIDPNKRNFARAQLIIMAIGVVLSFAFFGSVMAFLVAAFSNGYY